MIDEHPEHDRWGAGLPDDLVDGALEAALGAAETTFTAESGSAPSPGSAASTRDEGERTTTPERLGRYEVLGEVARGGVGAVLRGRDPEIGREVAIKLLLDRHGANPDMARRLLEEGQIAGQLQHPGIVPVHELGRGEDQRPYFTMKLVRGETLGTLLQKRSDGGERRQHFLRIVLQVCEAVAYAHSRGVVHRDLKPTNVMIGAFGEVQVMDWGLAKVLADSDERGGETAGETSRDDASVRERASESVAGSVMGTPAYMAPEQARGEPAKIDRRTDVFGLGAILCEVLTGKPPYTGATVSEVLAQAKSGDPAPARARLEACGADGTLVTLALRCLASARESRPRDAGEVSDALRVYLESLEERARSLALEAAAAKVRAEGERKTRVRTLGAAAALLLVLAALIVVAGFLVAGSRKAEVSRVLEERAREALQGFDERLAQREARALERLRSVDVARLDTVDAVDAVRAISRDEPLVAQPFALASGRVLWPLARGEADAVEVPWQDPATSETEDSLLDAVYGHLAAGRREEAIVALQAITRPSAPDISFSARAESALQLVTLLASAPSTSGEALAELDRFLLTTEDPPEALAHAVRQWRFAALDRKVALLVELDRFADAAPPALALLEELTGNDVWRRHAGARDLYVPRLLAHAKAGRILLSAEERARWEERAALVDAQDREHAFRDALERTWRARIESLPARGGDDSPQHLLAGDERTHTLLVVERGPVDGEIIGFLASWPLVEEELRAALATTRLAGEPPAARGVVDRQGDALAGEALGAHAAKDVIVVDAPRGRPWRLWLDAAPLRAQSETRVALLFGGFLAADLVLLAVFAAGAVRGAFGARRASFLSNPNH